MYNDEEETLKPTRDNGIDFNYCTVVELDAAKQFIEDYDKCKEEGRLKDKDRLRVVEIVE